MVACSKFISGFINPTKFTQGFVFVWKHLDTDYSVVSTLIVNLLCIWVVAETGSILLFSGLPYIQVPITTIFWKISNWFYLILSSPVKKKNTPQIRGRRNCTVTCARTWAPVLHCSQKENYSAIASLISRARELFYQELLKL